MTSASTIGNEWGGERRNCVTVDLPVAMDPVRPRRSMAVDYGSVYMLVCVGFMATMLPAVLS